MALDGWITLAVLAVVVTAMMREIAGPDLIVMAGLLALAAAGVLSASEAFHGFSNQAVATIGALFIVSAGVRETGLLDDWVPRVFGRARGELTGLLRMCPPVAAMSAFLNNAPIVAMMTPVVIDWARRQGRSPSHFLIPLSYATMLGSTLTIMGTSVNLAVAGLMLDAGMTPMGFFELAPIGLPICAAGLLYLVLLAPRWIPSRRELSEQLGEHRREYTTAMRVEASCRMVGRTVEEAGLRQLPGLFLVEIDRDGRTITPVGPGETVEAGDRLVFAGVVSTIVDLQRIPGLVPATEEEDWSLADSRERRLIEAVISASSPLMGQSVREANFRTVYDAAVVAVHRNGERVGGKIGEIVLRPGDTLLLQTAPGFMRAHYNSPDFYLVSELPDSQPLRTDKARIALAILAAMVAVVVAGWLPISVAAFLAAGALVATRCINGRIARRSVDWSILIVIGAGFGLALAMQKTGAAEEVARVLVRGAGPYGAIATLAVVYAATLVLAEMLHHAAAAAIMFPIALAAATQVGAEPRGFVLGVAIAATCAFANPTTYQTHLIVYGPGGYRFKDFVRVGLPLDLLCGVVALVVIPQIWPF